MTDFKLKYQIVADAAKAKAEVREFDDVLKGAGTRLGALGTPAVAAGAAIVGIGAAAVGAGAALFNLSKSAADYGSEIFDASKKTGLHAESLSAMKFAADQSGTSLEAITTGVAKFAKTVGAANEDTKKGTKFLEDFGLTPQQAIADLDGALGKVFKKIIDAPPGIERMTLAQKAFGRSGADLLPFLDSFDGDLGKLIKKAKELGVTIDDEAARAADEFGDQLDTLNAQFGAIGRTIGQEFMPVFLDMAKGVSGWLVQNKDEIARWGQQLADTLGGLIGYWKDFHKAAAGDGRAYTVNAAGERMYASDFLFSGALGAALSNRGAQARMGRAGGFGGGGGATDFEFDPVTMTMRPRSATVPLPRGGGEGGGGAKKGRVSSADTRTDKQVYQDFVAELKKLGVTINSGFRTYAQQAALYARLPRGQAAVPGTSAHEFYRAVDLPADVSQATLERAARAAGVTLGKRNVHEGTGRHLHQAFRKGRFTGDGEEAMFANVEAERKALEEFERLMEDTLQDMAAEMISSEERVTDERLNIRQKEADHAVEIIRGMVRTGEMTELESMQRLGELKIDMLLDEKRELEEQIPTIKNRQRLEEIRLELDTQRLENLNDEEDYWKRINDEIQKVNRALEKRNQRPTNLKTRTGPGEGTGFLDQLYEATGRVQTMDDVLQQLGQTATDVFMQMSQGIAATLTAFIMLGDESDVSAKKMMASLLASVAQQAFTLAIFHTAMGIAALTPWGAAMYGSPTNHFMAAAIWGGIGLGTALGARGLSGGGGGAGAGGGAGGYGGNGRAERSTVPISRVTDDAYISGRRTDPATVALAKAVDKLEKKISGMRAGDVLVAGSRQKRGFIGNQAAEDVKGNAAIGVKLGRSMGMK